MNPQNMLELQELVLENVHDNQTLFEKELRKSFKWLGCDDLRKLYSWLMLKFNKKHFQLIKSIFSEYNFQHTNYNSLSNIIQSA